MTNKKRLSISFSGGRTSAIMTQKCLEHYSNNFEIIITFANTGQEHNNTLLFVNQCSNKWEKEFNNKVRWIEAIITHEKGKGIRAKEVCFDTAFRWNQYKETGHPFTEYIKKYGICNQARPNCTSRLKEDAMYAFLRDEIGWKKGSYHTAIGIRSDEIDRMSTTAKDKNLIYPLVKLGYTVEMVKKELKTWEFDLDLKGDHYGNCVTCWKKSFRKLFTIAKNDPQFFKFNSYIEKNYGRVKVDEGIHDRTFFRKNNDTNYILEECKKPFVEYKDSDLDGYIQTSLFEESLADWEFWDKESSCGSSCEIGADN